jgi:hypothetical protein
VDPLEVSFSSGCAVMSTFELSLDTLRLAVSIVSGCLAVAFTVNPFSSTSPVAVYVESFWEKQPFAWTIPV